MPMPPAAPANATSLMFSLPVALTVTVPLDAPALTLAPAPMPASVRSPTVVTSTPAPTATPPSATAPATPSTLRLPSASTATLPPAPTVPQTSAAVPSGMLVPHGRLDGGAALSASCTRVPSVWLHASVPLALVSLWLHVPPELPVALRIRLFVTRWPSFFAQSLGFVSGSLPLLATSAW